MKSKPIYSFIFAVVTLSLLSATGVAQLAPEWVSRVSLGNSLSAGPAGIHVDPDGTSYLTGISGSSSDTNITTTSFAPDGSTRWSRTWSGPRGGDQARALAKGPNGVLYVVGNTLNQNAFANVLILAYDATTGTLLDTFLYSTNAFTSEIGSTIAVDSANNIYVGGTTNGDATDVMTLKFNPDGDVLWRKTWDGDAFGPYSNDGVVKVLLDSSGNPLVLITGEMASNHPDYVVVKYDATSGNMLWEANWGVDGEDYPSDMEIDAAGDVYVTGIGIDGIDKYSTIKLSGTNGQLIWQRYDALGNDHSANGLFLDGKGGVLVTGASDPEGNHSNFNDDFFTVKRDATTGALLWTHVYGDPCVGCYDVPSDVRVDSEGHTFVVGSTSSPPYSNDIILFVLDNATGTEITRGVVFSSGSEVFNSGPLRFDAAFNLYDGGRIYNANTGALAMSVTKWTSLVDGGGGILCEDLISFRARCNSSGTSSRLRARVTFTDTSHSGEEITVTVDGEPITVQVQGRRAELLINRDTPGPHTFELTNPSGCFAPIVRDCVEEDQDQIDEVL